jgi:curved DNA-binding protein CbpA
MNYYEILGITRESEKNEIKKAYFAAVKRHSPDADPEGFKSIRLAYETLHDDKSRAKYDAQFIDGMDKDIQDGLLTARNLLDDNRPKEASDLLQNLKNSHPHIPELRRLYAETLWQMKKSGTADKICQELLDDNPEDYETLVLRARIAESRGHVQKSGGFFNEAIAIDSKNPKAWSIYFRLAKQNNYLDMLPAQIFEKALKISPEIFKDDYILYFLGIEELSHLYGEHEYIQLCYDMIIGLFSADHDHGEARFHSVMNMIPHVVDVDDIDSINFLERLLPHIEASPHRHADQKGGKFTTGEKFKMCRAMLAEGKLNADSAIHEVLGDLTHHIISEDTDTDSKLGMECYIVSQLPEIRTSLKHLRANYPQHYALNQPFYDNCLDTKKTQSMQDKYYAIHKKLISKLPSKLAESLSGNDVEEFIEAVEQALPFLRETPKIGRNDPCPCGSGKKYKRCCG